MNCSAIVAQYLLHFDYVNRAVVGTIGTWDQMVLMPEVNFGEGSRLATRLICTIVGAAHAVGFFYQGAQLWLCHVTPQNLTT